MRELFSRCRQGASLRQLAKWLQMQGIPTQRGGKAWYPSTVRYLIGNPVYKGEPVFGRFQWRTDEGRTQQGLKPVFWHRGPVSEQATLSCEALVDAAMWEICQTRIQENPQLLSGPVARRYMLTGLFRCPNCGRSMASSLDGRRTLYYHCPESRLRHSLTGSVCTKKMHRSDKIEAMLLRDICLISRKPERFTDALRTFERKTRQSLTQPEDAEKLRSELAELDRQENATAQAQVTALMQGRSTEVYDRLLADIDARRKLMQARLKELEACLTRPEKTDFRSDTERIMEAMRRVEGVLTAEELSAAEKHQVLSMLIKRTVPEGEDAYRVELRSSAFNSAQGLESVQMISTHCPPGASR